MRASAAILTAGLMVFLMAGTAFAGTGPKVVGTDCDQEVATVRVELPGNHFVEIVDGDGFVTRIDGPYSGTVELETDTYQWTEWGIDDSGKERFKGEGELKPGDCRPDEETTTTRPDTTCDDKPKDKPKDRPCESTTTTTAPEETTTTERTVTSDETVPDTSAPQGVSPSTITNETTTTVGEEVASSIVTPTTVAPITSPDTLPFTGPVPVAGLGVAGGASVLFGIVALAAARIQRRR